MERSVRGSRPYFVLLVAVHDRRLEEVLRGLTRKHQKRFFPFVVALCSLEEGTPLAGVSSSSRSSSSSLIRRSIRRERRPEAYDAFVLPLLLLLLSSSGRRRPGPGDGFAGLDRLLGDEAPLEGGVARRRAHQQKRRRADFFVEQGPLAVLVEELLHRPHPPHLARPQKFRQPRLRGRRRVLGPQVQRRRLGVVFPHLEVKGHQPRPRHPLPELPTFAPSPDHHVHLE
mmetsp:Transcript_32248/g.102830  ORF Transcript_32248/g.102830 Transcript_32248/m.102830 type:complete len:228 (-) Transcript_32248:80-763(-)